MTPFLASWIRVIEHHKRGNLDPKWSFAPQDEPCDEVQTYFHYVWIEEMESKNRVADLVNGIFENPNSPAMQAMAAAIQASNEAKRQLAAEKRGVKISPKNVIRRAHKPQ